MPQQDLIPPKDNQFNIFQEDVVTTCDTNKVAWNIPPTTITDLQALQTAWSAAWLIAKDKGNRSMAQVTAKDNARQDFEGSLRPFIQQYVQLNSAVTNADRVSMNIKPKDKNRTKVPVPTTIPMVDMMPGNGSTLLVNFRQQPDAQGSSRRGKPQGVSNCEFYYKVGGEAPVSPAECPVKTTASRSPLTLSFDPAQSGTRVWTYGRWVNTTGQAGPWIISAVTAVIP